MCGNGFAAPAIGRVGHGKAGWPLALQLDGVSQLSPAETPPPTQLHNAIVAKAPVPQVQRTVDHPRRNSRGLRATGNHTEDSYESEKELLKTAMLQAAGIPLLLWEQIMS